MTTTIDTSQWCGRFVECKGCNLDAECMIRPEEMAMVIEDGKIVDKWAIRTTAMIAREMERSHEILASQPIGNQQKNV